MRVPNLLHFNEDHKETQNLKKFSSIFEKHFEFFKKGNTTFFESGRTLKSNAFLISVRYFLFQLGGTMSFLNPLSPHLWNFQKARHLLNRAGFGIPTDRANEMVKQGLANAVDFFIQYQKQEDSIPAPEWTQKREDTEAIQMATSLLGLEERQMLVKDLRQQERQQVLSLKNWWFRKMAQTKRPLQEKMALFWHGHFATSAQKVKDAWANYDINQIFRESGMGNFKTLTLKVGQSPAMLRYLDNVQNVKGKPNENWARELMELFTLGIGNYTEQDIKEAARAFTGWTHRGGEFIKNDRQHDFGPKTFLGKTGNFEGEDILEIIFEQKAAHEFLPKKLWEFFVYENPEPELVAELGKIFAQSYFEIAPLLKTIFLSEAFYSEKAIQNQIKSPIQLMLGLLDGLEVDFFKELDHSEDGDSDDDEDENGMMNDDDAQKRKKLRRFNKQKGQGGRQQKGQFLQLAMRQMGQELFLPPNVKGWPGNRQWINTNTILVRYNLSSFLVNGVIPQVPKRLELDDMIQNQRRERRIMQRLLNQLEKAPFDASAFFNRYVGFTLGETVDLLIHRFLGTSLSSEQRKILIDAFQAGSEESVLSLQTVEENHLRGVIHLLLSLVEYQLC